MLESKNLLISLYNKLKVNSLYLGGNNQNGVQILIPANEYVNTNDGCSWDCCNEDYCTADYHCDIFSCRIF